MVLSRDFYEQTAVVELACQLLGKLLVSEVDGWRTAGLIAETEAYCGACDRACHAYGNRRTARTSVMFGPGGHAYVYLCYGLHDMFNVVAGPPDIADAVLIRGLIPVEGIEYMQYRRKISNAKRKLITGPGTLTQAMGIGRQHNGHDLTTGHLLWIEDCGVHVPSTEVQVTSRIGIAYAGEDAQLPWRFVWQADQLSKTSWIC